jgi:hypothetical protein
LAARRSDAVDEVKSVDECNISRRCAGAMKNQITPPAESSDGGSISVVPVPSGNSSDTCRSGRVALPTFIFLGRSAETGKIIASTSSGPRVL